MFNYPIGKDCTMPTKAKTEKTSPPTKAVGARKKTSPTPTKGRGTKVAQEATQTRSRKAVKTASPATTTRKAANRGTAPKKSAGKKPAKTDVLTKGKGEAINGKLSFRSGSDAEYAFNELLVGGESRRDIQQRIAQHFAGTPTPQGNPKPITTVVNQVIRRAVASGEYAIEQTWKLVPTDPTNAVSVETNKPAPVREVKDHVAKTAKRVKKTSTPAKAAKPGAKARKSSAATTS